MFGSGVAATTPLYPIPLPAAQSALLNFLMPEATIKV